MGRKDGQSVLSSLRWLAANLVRKTRFDNTNPDVPPCGASRWPSRNTSRDGSNRTVMEQQPLAQEPCPCSSKQPFASCCADRYLAELSAWLRRRQAEYHLVPQILEYERRTWGLELRDEAIGLFYVSQTSSESEYSAAPAFMRWFPFTWVPGRGAELENGACEIPATWPTASLGVTWLASASSSVSDFEETFIVTAARSPYSLLLIESVVPGWSLAVKDLLTGRRFRIVDPEISQCVSLEQILFSAVLTIDGLSTLFGCACHAVPSDLRLMASAMREYHAEGAWLTTERLLDITPEISSEYRGACDCDTAVEYETYGDALGPRLLRWSVSAPFSEMFERLRSLSVWHGSEQAIEDETGPDGVLRLVISWYAPPPPPEPEDRKALGFLYLDDGRLAAHVATRALGERLVGEISARLGSAATLVETRPSIRIRIHSRPDELPPFLRVDPETRDGKGR
jgi:hypothetical protein